MSEAPHSVQGHLVTNIEHFMELLATAAKDGPTTRCFIEFSALEEVGELLKQTDAPRFDLYLALPRMRDVEEMLDWMMPRGPIIRQIQESLRGRSIISSLIPRMPESVLNNDADDSIREVLDLVINYFENNLANPVTMFFDLILTENLELRSNYLFRNLDVQNALHVNRLRYKHIPIIGCGCTMDSLEPDEPLDERSVGILIDHSIQEKTPLLLALSELPMSAEKLHRIYDEKVRAFHLASSTKDTVPKQDTKAPIETDPRRFLKVFTENRAVQH